MIDDGQMMHGRDYAGEDLRGWWIGEKLNGVRAYWDGREMWTRAGNRIEIPGAWRAELPAEQLDGELYAGASRFNEAFAAAVYGRFSRAVRFHVFDAPGPGVFGDRIARAYEATDRTICARAEVHFRAVSTKDAASYLQTILVASGEGVIARHPENVYAPGRTKDVLKLKPGNRALERAIQSPLKGMHHDHC